jgi:hypothetical protein
LEDEYQEEMDNYGPQGALYTHKIPYSKFLKSYQISIPHKFPRDNSLGLPIFTNFCQSTGKEHNTKHCKFGGNSQSFDDLEIPQSWTQNEKDEIDSAPADMDLMIFQFKTPLDILLTPMFLNMGSEIIDGLLSDVLFKIPLIDR